MNVRDNDGCSPLAILNADREMLKFLGELGTIDDDAAVHCV